MARQYTSAGAAVVFSMLSLGGAAQAQVRYEVTDLGPAVRSLGMNDDGEVVGIMRGADGLYHGFYAHDGALTDIGSLGGHPTFARDVNAAGHIVGSSITSQGREHAFLYQEGAMIDLGTFGGVYSHANGINNAGQVAGDAEMRDHGQNSGEKHAFIWENGDMTDLGTLGGAFSAAFGINEHGHVVGWAWDEQWDSRPFMWTPADGMIDLGDLGGGTGSAADINDLGHVVGSARLPGGLVHATLWRDGQIFDLGVFPGAGPEPIETNSAAINNAGQVVGNSYPSFNLSVPFLWEDGLMVNLNDLIDPAAGWEISRADDINESGQIAATARGADGEYHALLLTPICVGDTNGDGLLDFFDVQAFLDLFAAQDPAADLNDDGLHDFFDVQAFLDAFAAGCP